MVFIAIMAAAMGIAILVGLAVHAVLCWFVSGLLKRVPPQYRQAGTGHGLADDDPVFQSGLGIFRLS